MGGGRSIAEGPVSVLRLWENFGVRKMKDCSTLGGKV